MGPKGIDIHFFNQLPELGDAFFEDTPELEGLKTLKKIDSNEDGTLTAEEIAEAYLRESAQLRILTQAPPPTAEEVIDYSSSLQTLANSVRKILETQQVSMESLYWLKSSDLNQLDKRFVWTTTHKLATASSVDLNEIKRAFTFNPFIPLLVIDGSNDSAPDGIVTSVEIKKHLSKELPTPDEKSVSLELLKLHFQIQNGVSILQSHKKVKFLVQKLNEWIPSQKLNPNISAEELSLELNKIAQDPQAINTLKEKSDPEFVTAWDTLLTEEYVDPSLLTGWLRKSAQGILLHELDHAKDRFPKLLSVLSDALTPDFNPISSLSSSQSDPSEDENLGKIVAMAQKRGEEFTNAIEVFEARWKQHPESIPAVLEGMIKDNYGLEVSLLKELGILEFEKLRKLTFLDKKAGLPPVHAEAKLFEIIEHARNDQGKAGIFEGLEGIKERFLIPRWSRNEFLANSALGYLAQKSSDEALKRNALQKMRVSTTSKNDYLDTAELVGAALVAYAGWIVVRPLASKVSSSILKRFLKNSVDKPPTGLGRVFKLIHKGTIAGISGVSLWNYLRPPGASESENLGSASPLDFDLFL